MSYRYMRIVLFFDLPTITNNDKRNYRNFRNFLIKNGFLMLQESVYCKLALNSTVVESVLNLLRKNKPVNGSVQILTITEKQFQKMEFLVGEYSTDTINTDERLIIL